MRSSQQRGAPSSVSGNRSGQRLMQYLIFFGVFVTALLWTLGSSLFGASDPDSTSTHEDNARGRLSTGELNGKVEGEADRRRSKETTETNNKQPTQDIHWIFTSDCSAYQFNQGNVLLESAEAVGIDGNWTWIMYGCTKAEQLAETKKIGNPSKSVVWHVPPILNLVHPDTGEEVGHFQASNRPYGIEHWWNHNQHMIAPDTVIGLVDPDQIWLRKFQLDNGVVYPNKYQTQYAEDFLHSPAGSKTGSTASAGVSAEAVLFRLKKEVAHRNHLRSMTARTQTNGGPWMVPQVMPGIGGGGRYAMGVFVNNAIAKSVCNVYPEKDYPVQNKACLQRVSALSDSKTAMELFNTGPPWLMHRKEAAAVIPIFLNTTVRAHELRPELLAEQHSVGIAQMVIEPIATTATSHHHASSSDREGRAAGVAAALPSKDQLSALLPTNHIDHFWVLSDAKVSLQPWSYVVEDPPMKDVYDPCDAREPPHPINVPSPVTWHACSSYLTPEEVSDGSNFKLHKDHIPKDILDCDSPLLKYPPRDALRRLREIHEKSTEGYGYAKHALDRKYTWGVCLHVVAWNRYVTNYKKKYCTAPNLEPTMEIVRHAAGFNNASSRLKGIFRKGGWTDIDYCPSGNCKAKKKS